MPLFYTGFQKTAKHQNTITDNLTKGFLRGKWRNGCFQITQSTSLLGRLGSPRTIREVLGDSLHTFSSVRKYDTNTLLNYAF